MTYLGARDFQTSFVYKNSTIKSPECYEMNLRIKLYYPIAKNRAKDKAIINLKQTI